MSKIKILFTQPNFDTAGSGRVVYDLVKGLDRNKFEPEICCKNNKGSFFKEVEKLGVPIHVFSFTTELKPYVSFVFRIIKIARFFRQHKFDIIHSWHWSSDISEPLAAKIAGVKWIYTKKAMSWGNPKLWKFRTLLANKILVLNSDMISIFFQSYKHKVNLVYLGVNTEQFMPQSKVYQLPSGEEFKKDDFVIVTIANLVPIKGIEYLMKAVNDLEDQKVKLLVVGNNQNDYGQKLIQENTNSNIKFINKVLDVRPYHAVADVFVIPTKTSWEGLPVAPLEAMSSQRIVLGANVEGVREVLLNFKECMFSPKNSEEIKTKILWIRHMNSCEREKLALQMREEVLRRFELNNSILKHQDIYSLWN